MATEIINVLLQLTDNLTKGIDSATAKVSSFGDKVGKLASAFTPVSLAAGAALGVSIKLASDFDKAIQGAVRGLDLSGSEVIKFTEEIQRLQKELNYQFSGTELANLATSAGKLGVAKGDIDDFTKSIARIAVATDQADNIEKLATNAAKINTVFKLSVQQSDAFLNAVNKLDDATSATSNELLNFTQRTAGVAATAKVSATQLAAFGATIISAGQAPEVAATFMNKYMSVLGAATNMSKDAKSALAKLGYSATQLSSDFDKNANATMLTFLQRVGQLSKVEQRAVLGKIFGQEHIDSALLLVQQTSELTKNLKYAGDAAGNAAKAQNEFNKASQSFEGLSKTFKNQLQEIGVQLGLVLLPALIDLMKVVSPLVQNLVTLTQQHPQVTKLIAALLGITAVVAPVLALVSAISAMLPVLAAVGAAVVTVIGVIVSAPGLVAVAIAAIVASFGYAAYQIVRNWEPIKKYCNDLWRKVSTTISYHVGVGVSEASKKISEFVKWLGNVGTYIYQSAVSWGQGLLQGFINGMESKYANAQNAVNNFTGMLRKYLPHSDAKKGGLSDLTASGQAFADTFLKGIQSSGLDTQLGNYMQAPKSGGLSSIRPPVSNASANINYAPTYTINSKDSQDIINFLKKRDKELLDLISKSNTRIYRSSY